MDLVEWGREGSQVITPLPDRADLCDCQLPANDRAVKQLKDDEVQNRVVSAGLIVFH